jgi:hypothetical protein
MISALADKTRTLDELVPEWARYESSASGGVLARISSISASVFRISGPRVRRSTIISRTGMLGPYVKPVPPPQNGFSHGPLWKCRVVLRQSRELAQQVLDGKIALHAAFNVASPPDTALTTRMTPAGPRVAGS